MSFLNPENQLLSTSSKTSPTPAAGVPHATELDESTTTIDSQGEVHASTLQSSNQVVETIGDGKLRKPLRTRAGLRTRAYCLFVECLGLPYLSSSFLTKPIYMRLLNTKSLKLHEFQTDIPPYAILSHTWEREEVTFQDIQNLQTAKRKAGYTKVKNACARAQRYSFEWIWIDSCCINKESSAELSEAINSMYQYYEDAVVCYVYLGDVSAKEHPRDPKSTFRDSRWFKRGWTLQELLAPIHVVFLDKDWTRIGTRSSLRDVISAVTTIPVGAFEGRDVAEYSVAQRMSWAALRGTTRPEDMAYSLMGIFGVSMPPIYGEGGAKAFMRLQQEIIKISDDRSIFAWVASEESGKKERGLLARSPYEFRMSGEVEASKSDDISDRSSYSFGNNGLRIHLPLEEFTDSSSSSSHRPHGKDIVLAFLLCQSSKDSSYLSIYLRKTNGKQYVRCYPDELVLRPSPPSLDNLSEITVREQPVVRLHRTDKYTHVVVYHVQLLPSARLFVCEDSSSPFSIASRFRLSSNSSSSFTVPVLLSWWEEVALTYKLEANGEKAFTLQFARQSQPSLYTLQLYGTGASQSHSDGGGDGQAFSDTSDPHMGRLLGRVDKGGYISVTCEMRGQPGTRSLEIEYIPITISKDLAKVTLITVPKLHPPDSGFLVPLFSNHLQLREVYPPDLFGKRLQSMVYVTSFNNSDYVASFDMMDNTGNTASPSAFRLLTYHVSRDFLLVDSPIFFYVMLGMQEEGQGRGRGWSSAHAVPWVEIVWPSVNKTPKNVKESFDSDLGYAEGVWKIYASRLANRSTDLPRAIEKPLPSTSTSADNFDQDRLENQSETVTDADTIASTESDFDSYWKLVMASMAGAVDVDVALEELF
ncbi:hypothetical protein D9758_002896 [Tetrapyrgos nigripes]|uniref:HET-domain-containing protein n=1 Tax=Tetrapyrgos nigripes TaxID=182062 RepID=A0A8H5LSY0_9AGAR|nr:hypothetical protein D9758_002896 [Tetrapyrgos nigripes]